MSVEGKQFWGWFTDYVKHLEPPPSEQQLDELFNRLQEIDDRLYFQLSNNTDDYEMIITADGDVDAFPVVDMLVDCAPGNLEWEIIALKPPLGFDFKFQNNGFEINASELWFLPLESKANPDALGVKLGVPNADDVIGSQTVDAAYSILETGLGERMVATEVQHVTVGDLPEDPAAEGYIEIFKLEAYIEWRRSNRIIK